METHRLHAELLRREVRILVVGCGGTGSAILGSLSGSAGIASSDRCRSGGNRLAPKARSVPDWHNWGSARDGSRLEAPVGRTLRNGRMLRSRSPRRTREFCMPPVMRR